MLSCGIFLSVPNVWNFTEISLIGDTWSWVFLKFAQLSLSLAWSHLVFLKFLHSHIYTHHPLTCLVTLNSRWLLSQLSVILCLSCISVCVCICFCFCVCVCVCVPINCLSIVIQCLSCMSPSSSHPSPSFSSYPISTTLHNSLSTQYN